jgi:hypothetical protein
LFVHKTFIIFHAQDHQNGSKNNFSVLFHVIVMASPFPFLVIRPMNFDHREVYEAEFCFPKEHVEILNHGISNCGLIWK